jgi:sugar lactone lactonase YvrE
VIVHRFAWTLGFVVSLGFLIGCGAESPEPPAETAEDSQPIVEVLATGAGISGANGMHFSPDGKLYVASVLGSELIVLDPDSGAVLERLQEGVDGPDDVAFNARGDFFWTSILTGEVAGMTAEGERITAARLTPGVNPITFSDDGRLFVSQCFFDDKLYEVDPAGIEEPRLISDQLGPGCGLNGMDWGPDGRLYGPRWFQQQVVSFDVDSGEMRVDVTGLAVPAAVKFDSKGVLHILDTGAAEVIAVKDGKKSVVVRLVTGLDNIAFDAEDRLFVSSFADGAVWRIDEGEPVALSPGGMAHPGGLTFLERDGKAQVVVGDLHAIRAFDPESGDELFTQRNVLGVGELGSTSSLSADGENLILCSFTENNVRVWDPVAERNLERFDHLQGAVSAIRYGDALVVAEHAAGHVRVLGGENPQVLATGLAAPTALLTDGRRLWVSDREAGRVLLIAENGAAIEPVVIAEGLAAPEGLALWGDRVLVREGETGRVMIVGDGAPSLLVTLGTGSPGTWVGQTPSMIFNDIEVRGDTLFATNEHERQLVRVKLGPGD